MPLLIVFHLETDRTGRIFAEYDEQKDDYRVVLVTGKRVIEELIMHVNEAGYFDALDIPPQNSPYWGILQDNSTPDEAKLEIAQRMEPLISLLSIEFHQWIHTKRAPVGEIFLHLSGSRGRVWGDYVRWPQLLRTSDRRYPHEIHERSN